MRKRINKSDGELVLLAAQSFRKWGEKDDIAVDFSIGRFESCLENGMPHDDGRMIASHKKLALAFIEETRTCIMDKIQDADSMLKEDLLQQTKEVLKRIDANANALGVLQSDLAKLHNITGELKAASGTIVSHTSDISSAVPVIVAEVKKAVKNTSTKIAIVVGLGTGIAGGLGTNYIYERHFSKAALDGAKIEQTVPVRQPSPSRQSAPVKDQQQNQPKAPVYIPPNNRLRHHQR